MADLFGMLQAAAGAGGVTPTGYQIERSLRFNSADSAYLSRTPAGAGNRKTWTWSGWVKFSIPASGYYPLFGAMASTAYIELSTDYKISYRFSLTDSVRTDMVFRDPSAWYHLVFVADTTQATDTNRLKAYVNGVQVSLTPNLTWPSLNEDGGINTTVSHTIGADVGNSSYQNGYLTEVNFVDGQALTPSDFGETDATTGVWKPKAYTGSYGTNGFYLNFSDNTSTTTLGEDQAGSNDWTLNNFSVTAGAGNDSLVDTPTPYGTDTGAGGEVRGNYCTWNPLINGDSAANGSLDVTNDTARGTQELLQYDAYWEITSTGGTTTAGVVSGTGTTNTTTVANTKTYGFRLTTSGTLDYINITDGGSFTNITTGLTGQQFPYASAASATTGSLNAGQRPFAATAPSGFKALCTQNLPTPTVVQGDDYFNTVLYTGTGSSQSITGVGFQPDWVWIKERSGAADHGLYDAVRGVQNQLESNTTTAETAEATGLTAFGSDGFTVGALAQLNTNTDTYVAWNWNAGGSNATNTDGTITSTVRANPTAGFSIVSYTGNGTRSGQTVGHGLGVAPSMIIHKPRSTTGGWFVTHSGIPNAWILLNSTDASATGGGTNGTLNYQSTNTTTVFSFIDGSSSINNVNGSGTTYIAYCFAEIEGYSKFGSYTGNGSTDGPFVYCGFRPAWLLVKRSSAAGNFWILTDTARGTYNVMGPELYPNASDAETAGTKFDYLSNGFKLRSNAAAVNNSTDTYIFAAFAENPFKYSLAR